MNNRLLMCAAILAAGFAGAVAVSMPASALAQDAPASDRGEPRRDDEPRRVRGRAMPPAPDWPRAGGFGPERPGNEGMAIEALVAGDFGRRELTDDDLARAVAVAREVSPEWGEVIATRARENPEQMKEALRSGARRLLALTALKERAPRVFAAKVAELRSQGETMRAATELRRLETDPGATEEALAEARAALDACAARQVEATIAARAEELSALEQHIERMRKDLARDSGNVDALTADVAKRALERGPRRAEGREEPGGPGGPDAGPPDGPPGPPPAPR